MPQTADAALGRVVSVDARARRCLFVGVIGDIRGLAGYNMKLPTPGGVRPLGVKNGRYGFSSASSQAWRLRYNDGVTDWRFPVCGSGSLGWPCLYFAPLSSIRSDLVRSHYVGYLGRLCGVAVVRPTDAQIRPFWFPDCFNRRRHGEHWRGFMTILTGRGPFTKRLIP
jgi:hypothetical protein